MNRIHGRFAIANEDFLYVLSTFVFEPIRWNARFGWRPLTEEEKLATFHFWREVGRRMAIKEIPESYDEFERYNEDYERRHFRRTEQAAARRAAPRGTCSSPGFPGCRSGSARRRSTRSWTSRSSTRSAFLDPPRALRSSGRAPVAGPRKVRRHASTPPASTPEDPAKDEDVWPCVERWRNWARAPLRAPCRCRRVLPRCPWPPPRCERNRVKRTRG